MFVKKFYSKGLGFSKSIAAKAEVSLVFIFYLNEN